MRLCILFWQVQDTSGSECELWGSFDPTYVRVEPLKQVKEKGAGS